MQSNHWDDDVVNRRNDVVLLLHRQRWEQWQRNRSLAPFVANGEILCGVPIFSLIIGNHRDRSIIDGRADAVLVQCRQRPVADARWDMDGKKVTGADCTGDDFRSPQRRSGKGLLVVPRAQLALLQPMIYSRDLAR